MAVLPFPALAATLVPSATTEQTEMTGIAGWAVDVMEALGALGAGLLIALENIFPPLPSEAILPLAGFAASRGDLSLVAALVFTTLGSLIGAIALYFVGYGIGLERIRRIAFKMPFVSVEDVDRTMAWFHRHGDKAVFFGRMIPLFRSLISIPAGVEGMPLARFSLLTFLGSALWNSIFVVAGYYLGENWHLMEEYAGIFQKIVIAVVAVLLIWWVVRKIRGRDRSHDDPDRADARDEA